MITQCFNICIFFSVRTVPDDLNEYPCNERLKDGRVCCSSYERAVPTSEQHLHFWTFFLITIPGIHVGSDI